MPVMDEARIDESRRVWDSVRARMAQLPPDEAEQLTRRLKDAQLRSVKEVLESEPAAPVTEGRV